ncbi:MAG: TRAP transporter fused permease subunit, partial [Nitriliruptorales bacterium]|nr:TRAP transporter fused permease subunit [Nitriliruptorales bacterium]
MTVGEGRVAAEDSTPAEEELTRRRSRLAGFSPGPQVAIRVIAALFALYFLLTTVRAVSLHQQLAVYLGGSLALIFLCYPGRKGSPGHRPSLVDLVWVAVTIAPTVYFIVNHDAMVLRAGIVSDTDVLFGAMITVASLEGCRRVLGWALPVLAACFVIYAVFGASFPGVFQHAGFSAERVIGSIFSSNGVYGIVARTYAVYVIIFIIFGAFLQLSGAGTAFTNLALALFGRATGGAAKAAVVSSALAGSVLGAGAANITVTGTFTIPVMKRTGFSAHKAGAVETVASIGGHLLPPVMGAAAFLMASFTGIPYTEIVVVSLVPALMLYVTLYASVHFYAVKHGLKDTTAKLDVPSFGTTLRRDALLLLPLVVLVASLFLGYSPFRAAVNGIVATIVIAQVRRLVYGEKRLGLRGLFEGLSQGALQSLMVGATAGVMGVLLAALLLPGTGLMLSSWIVQLSGGNLFIGLLFILVA